MITLNGCIQAYRCTMQGHPLIGTKSDLPTTIDVVQPFPRNLIPVQFGSVQTTFMKVADTGASV